MLMQRRARDESVAFAVSVTGRGSNYFGMSDV